MAYPRMSGANPPIRTAKPKPVVDTTMHMRSVYCYGDSMQDGFEVWTACGRETTSADLRTTYTSADVTCTRCRPTR